jgi:hypothetical protein
LAWRSTIAWASDCRRSTSIPIVAGDNGAGDPDCDADFDAIAMTFSPGGKRDAGDFGEIFLDSFIGH